MPHERTVELTFEQLVNILKHELVARCSIHNGFKLDFWKCSTWIIKYIQDIYINLYHNRFGKHTYEIKFYVRVCAWACVPVCMCVCMFVCVCVCVWGVKLGGNVPPDNWEALISMTTVLAGIPTKVARLFLPSTTHSSFAESLHTLYMCVWDVCIYVYMYMYMTFFCLPPHAAHWPNPCTHCMCVCVFVSECIYIHNLFCSPPHIESQHALLICMNM